MNPCSDVAVRVAGSLARWMRVFAVFCFIAAGLTVLGRVGVALQKGSVEALGSGIASVMVPMLAGVWLCQAAGRFRRGVRDTDVGMLARGFGIFRWYIFLVGVLGIAKLATTVHELVST